MTEVVSRAHIEEAHRRVTPHIRRTPVVELGHVVSERFRLSLKLDSLQPTGSFKVRGAFSLLTGREIPAVGVVAASGGNFALAIAYAAARLGHRATVFVPSSSPREKTDLIADLGAEVRMVEGYYPQALEASREWAFGSGALEAHAYDQHEVVAGQGTCGLEVAEQAPDVDAVLVAVGGGGLIGGIAGWFQDRVKVIGVESELCPTLNRARAAGGPVEVGVGGVTASSLGASRLGEHAWLANRWIDESLLVTDEQALDAQTWLWDTCRLVAEPGACTPIAALLDGFDPGHAEHVVAVVSGANTGVGLNSGRQQAP